MFKFFSMLEFSNHEPPVIFVELFTSSYEKFVNSKIIFGIYTMYENISSDMPLIVPAKFKPTVNVLIY